MPPHRRAPWHDAYDAQMALWRWYRTSLGHKWVTERFRVATRAESRDAAAMLARMWDAEEGRLIDCDPIYVSTEMCEVVDAARASFQPEPLLETDLLTPRGFLFFDRPLLATDRYGFELAVQALSWGREYAGDAEQVEEAERRLYSKETLVKYGSRIDHEEMDALIADGLVYPYGIGIALYANRDHFLSVTNSDPPQDILDATAHLPVVPFHVTPWHFGQEFTGNEVDALGLMTGASEWWTLAQTTFRLMQQRIAAQHVERAPRDHRREAKKLGLDHEPETVVIRLRREQGERSEPTGEEVPWSHRWIVGGHWRNQPYPSEGITRQIWISPYVKGPTDKPLIVRPRRVYQWER